jgi:4-hydroxybenzoyl-CoA reductase subunit alpha
MNAEFRVIGQPRPQLEGPAKVSGRAEYTHDIALPDMLYGAILRSPHAHAHIRSVDLSKARAMPGVVAIVCEADFPDLNYVNAGPVYADRAAMARGKVRFVGEEVAAVAAETLAEAQAAVAAIAVEYDPLPAVFDTDEALAPNAPVIHDKPDLPRNVAQQSVADFDGVEAAFEAADHIFDATFEHGIVAPVCLETNGVLAEYATETGDLTLWAPSQAPFFVRKEIARESPCPVGCDRRWVRR